VVEVGWLITGSLVAGRVTGVMLTLPVLSMSTLPKQARALLIFVLTLIIAPTLPPAIEPATLLSMTVCVASEVVIGILMGGIVRMVFGSLALAGELIGSQTGHAAARQFDPTLQLSQGPLGTLVTFLASAVFVGADMHLQFLVALGDSFYVIPPGARVDLMSGSIVWIELAGAVIRTGAQLAGPVVVLVFVINMVVAVITRLAPQMNIFFSVGMLLTLMAGMLIYFVSMPLMLRLHLDNVRASMDLLPDLMRQLLGL
jgi:flagellar biosynthesis protein FliR